MMKEQLSPRLLEGKTAVITGGAGGIGKAIAQAALREGAVVALLDINRKRLHETREELAPYGIRSNAVAPGLIVPTGITENMPENQLQKARAAIPLGKEGTPDDVAEIVVFLASDRAAYVTGAEWRVDGGISGISPVAR